jgi:hypothetical protein
MTVGGVLDEAWQLYRRFFGRFVVTAALLFAVLALIPALIGRTEVDDLFEALAWLTVALIVGIIGSLWVQAALVELVRDVRDGRADRSVLETYRAVAPRLGAVVVTGIIAGIAIGIGLLLFIVPGLILLTIWAMLIPAIVIEGCSVTQSFGRSREIVRGHGWSVFGLVVVTILISAVVSGVVGGLAAALPDLLAAWVGPVVSNSLTAPFTAAVLTTAYFRLTEGRERPALAPLERGF